MAKKTQTKGYIVRTQIGTGAAYLCVRKNYVREGKYYWHKGRKESAAVLSYSAAKRAANRYGGKAVLWA